VINSKPNLGPMSHGFRDTATYWQKIANFYYQYLFSFTALTRGDPFSNLAKKLYGS